MKKIPGEPRKENQGLGYKRTIERANESSTNSQKKQQ
jgi:hypothetical protein